MAEAVWEGVSRQAWSSDGAAFVRAVARHLHGRALEKLIRLLSDREQDDVLRHRLALAACCLAELPAEERGRHQELIDEVTSEVVVFSWEWLRDGDKQAWDKQMRRQTAPPAGEEAEEEASEAPQPASWELLPHLAEALGAIAPLGGRIAGQRLSDWLYALLREHQYSGPPSLMSALEPALEPPTFLATVETWRSRPSWDEDLAFVFGTFGVAAPPDVLAELARLLSGENQKVQLQVLGVLGAISPVELLRAHFGGRLLELANAPDPEVQREALVLGCSVGVTAPAFLDVLLAWLIVEVPRIKRDLAASFGLHADTALALGLALRERLLSAEAERRREALLVLEQLPEQARTDVLGGAELTPALEQYVAGLLRSALEEERAEGLAALSRWAPLNVRLAREQAVLPLLRGRRTALCRAAAQALLAVRSFDQQPGTDAPASASEAELLAAEEARNEASRLEWGPRLVKLLADRHPGARWSALWLLGQLWRALGSFGPDIQSRVAARLVDRSRAVRREALRLARWLTDLEFFPVFRNSLERFLRSGNRRAWAALGLLARTAPAPSLRSALEALAREQPFHARWSAARWQLRLPAAVSRDDLLDGVVTLLESPAPRDRQWAIWVAVLLQIEELPARFVARIAPLLISPEPTVSAAAQAVLGTWPRALATPAFIEELERMLSAPDAERRAMAVTAISHLGSAVATPSFLALIERFLEGRDAQQAWLGCAVLRSIGRPGRTEERLGRVIGLLRRSDPSYALRDGVRAVLQSLPPEDFPSSLLDELLTLARCLDREVRLATVPALSALASGGDADCQAALVEMLADSDPRVRTAARGDLERLIAVDIEPIQPRRLPALLQALDPAVRVFGLAAFGRLLRPDVVSAVRGLWPRLLEDEAASVRAEALRAVADVPDRPWPEVVARLPGLVQDEALEVKRAALHALAALEGQELPPGTPAALVSEFASTEWPSAQAWDDLVAAVRSLPAEAAPVLVAEWARRLGAREPAVRRQLLDALRRLDQPRYTQPLLPRITALLADSDAGVRYNAATLLLACNLPGERTERAQAVSLLLGDEDRENRYRARCAFNELGERALTPEFLRRLADALGSPDEEIVLHAVWAICSLGRATLQPVVLAGLTEAGRRPRLRVPLALALGGVGLRVLANGRVASVEELSVGAPRPESASPADVAWQLQLLA
jgi:hypothetical protein